MRNALQWIPAVDTLTLPSRAPRRAHVPAGGSWYEGGVSAPLALVEEIGEGALCAIVEEMARRVRALRAALPGADIRRENGGKTAVIDVDDGRIFHAYAYYGMKYGWSAFRLDAREAFGDILPPKACCEPVYL